MQIGINGFYYSAPACPDKFGCPSGVCPNFVIKRHDTKPAFKILVENCDGAMDLTDENLILEVNIWAKGKLKYALDAEREYFELADGIGFEQILVGDIIVMDRVRLPEYMLVTGFDEANKLVQVQRAYSGTTASSWKKGTPLRIFRTMGATGTIETITGDILNEDGTTTENELLETYLVYEWQSRDTCTPGCYWLEFKLLKMEAAEDDDSVSMLAATYSNISFTQTGLSYSDYGCYLGAGVEWVRRFPSESEGFLIKIENSFTTEL